MDEYSSDRYNEAERNLGQMRISLNQVYDSKLSYLKTKLLLSALKEVADKDGSLRPESRSKIKTLICFGRLDDFLEISSTEKPSAEKHSLFGISGQYSEKMFSLTSHETACIMTAIERNLQRKLELIVDVFDLVKPGISRTEVLRELPMYVTAAKETESSPKTSIRMYIQCENYLKSCYEELKEILRKLFFLGHVRLTVTSTVGNDLIREQQTRLNAVYLGSRKLNVGYRQRIYTSDVNQALKTLSENQKEEIKKKQHTLRAHKQEMSLYERIIPHGFEDLLNEYMDIEQKLSMNKKTLEDMFQKSVSFEMDTQN